jgi:hypothetical protein
MSSDENNLSPLAAQHGCSLWKNLNGNNYNLDADKWGPLLLHVTLEEIETCLRFGIYFHQSRVAAEKYRAQQKAGHDAAQAKQKRRKRVAQPPASATKRKSGAARKRKQS